MKTKFLAAAIFAYGSPISSVIAATTIDLQGLPGNFEQAEWNGGGTRIYAQSIQTPTIDRKLTSIAFNITGTSTINFDIIICGTRSNIGGLGLAPNFSDIRWQQSYSFATSGTVSASPNINFSASETFFVALVGQTPSGGSYTIEATQYNGTEQYTPGEFVYLNALYSESLTSASINNLEWDHRSPNNEDLAFKAVFTAVPEPSSVMLLGLGTLGFAMRRRRTA